MRAALAAVPAAVTEGSSLSVDVLPRQFSSALCVQLHGIASVNSSPPAPRARPIPKSGVSTAGLLNATFFSARSVRTGNQRS